MILSIPGPWDEQGFVLFSRLFLGSIFLMAGLAKIPRLSEFGEDVLRYRILWKPASTVYAVSLPFLELGASVLLFTGLFTGVAAGLVIVLLVTFMGAVASAMIRGLNVDCACFGVLYRERVGWLTQIRDSVLLLLALHVLIFADHADSLPELIANAGSLANLLALTLTAGVFIFSVLLSVPALTDGRAGKTPQGLS